MTANKVEKYKHLCGSMINLLLSAINPIIHLIIVIVSFFSKNIAHKIHVLSIKSITLGKKLQNVEVNIKQTTEDIEEVFEKPNI